MTSFGKSFGVGVLDTEFRIDLLSAINSGVKAKVKDLLCEGCLSEVGSQSSALFCFLSRNYSSVRALDLIVSP